MVARAKTRSQFDDLRAFVRVWDEFIAISQSMNSMNPKAAEYGDVRLKQARAQQAVVEARRKVGAVGD